MTPVQPNGVFVKLISPASHAASNTLTRQCSRTHSATDRPFGRHFDEFVTANESNKVRETRGPRDVSSTSFDVQKDDSHTGRGM